MTDWSRNSHFKKWG